MCDNNKINIIKKNNNFINELFSNPIHGLYGEDEQLRTIVHNNIILYDYFDNLWNRFKDYFNKNWFITILVIILYIMNNLVCECPLCIGFYYSLNFCKKIKNSIKKNIVKKEKYIIK